MSKTRRTLLRTNTYKQTYASYCDVCRVADVSLFRYFLKGIHSTLDSHYVPMKEERQRERQVAYAKERMYVAS